jgi:hypothetical protein
VAARRLTRFKLPKKANHSLGFISRQEVSLADVTPERVRPAFRSDDILTGEAK